MRSAAIRSLARPAQRTTAMLSATSGSTRASADATLSAAIGFLRLSAAVTSP